MLKYRLRIIKKFLFIKTNYFEKVKKGNKINNHKYLRVHDKIENMKEIFKKE